MRVKRKGFPMQTVQFHEPEDIQGLNWHYGWFSPSARGKTSVPYMVFAHREGENYYADLFSQFLSQVVYRKVREEMKEKMELESEIRRLRSYTHRLSTRIRLLEETIGKGRIIQVEKARTSISKIIYEESKEELEKTHFGKIVAIDNETKKIVGFGKNILEAYYDAENKTGKKKFSFIRVGYTDKLM